MNSKKYVAVMAGTPVDTAFGVRLVATLTKNFIPLPISSTPREQTMFQTMSEEKKALHIEACLQVHQNIACLLVYCNSLSGSLDFTRLSDTLGIPIFTPLHFYHTIAKQYTSFGVLSANAQGSAGIERALLSRNPQAMVYGITSLAWVEAIEQGRDPDSIVSQLGLQHAISFFEDNHVDCILLGCTHFPYFLKELQQMTTIPCHIPDTFLVEKVKQTLAVDRNNTQEGTVSV